MSKPNKPKFSQNDDDKVLLRMLAGAGEASDSAPSIDGAKLNAILSASRFILAANDDMVNDFLRLVENWPSGNMLNTLFSIAGQGKQASTGGASDAFDAQVQGIGKHTDNRRDSIVELAREWPTHEIRNLGSSLIRLADALDQEWDPDTVQLSFHWLSAAARIERKSLELARKASILQKHLSTRKRFLPESFLGEPAWNMLLELFRQFSGGAMMSTKSLCIAADCPETTALRYIDQLEEHDLLEREDSSSDGRVTMIKLSKKGVICVGRILERTLV